MAAHLNAGHLDHSDRVLRCGCGGQARYSGTRKKTFTTTLGPVTLVRAYYHCRDCAHGWYPKDRALGLERRTISPGVLRIIGLTAGRVSFAESRTLLRELAGLRVSVKQVERSARRLGRQIDEDERTRMDREPCEAKTRYLGLDGTGVPVRKSETAGRKGKQPDGSAKTREMKLVAIWTAEQTHAKGGVHTDEGSTTYTAAIESAATLDHDPEPSIFAQRVEREARRRGFQDAERQGVIADGAWWIWNLCSELFPDAVQIVDIYHAKEKIWEVARAVYGGESDLTKKWAEQRIQQLRAGDIETLVEGIQSVSGVAPIAAQAVGYFQRNQPRMRYRRFREKNLCISSAVVEAGCKQVVGTRLKRGGMHWTVAGANEIVALRSCLLSRRFDDFWYATAINQ